jgi:UDP-GlcNAc:undecaprenyl-phosphate/decaprenyl-phosphate GlcNAc-1-phosphate transferase
MSIHFFYIFFIAFFLSLLFAYLVKLLAAKLKIIDKPGGERKIHKTETPLLGGLAIFAAFFIILYFVRAELLSGNLEVRHWLGFFIGACFLMIGGFLDDKYNLKPSQQFIWPILAAIAVIAGGVQIEKITNPFGGIIYLKYFSAILIFLWLLGMMYTTKLLDGVDGLVTSVTAVGSFIIFLFTITTRYYQPDIGLAALILAGACLGFLILNWQPAKIFLGEGGSLFLGYGLGVLAIISGGKIAIALLVMGIPIMDVAWTIVRRLRAGKNPFKFADRQHLHFRLLNLGLSPQQTVLLYCAFSTAFGLSALFLQSSGKALTLAFLVILIAGFIIFIDSYLNKKIAKQK